MLKIAVYNAVLKENGGWICWHMPVVQLLGRQRQGNDEVEGNPGPHNKALSQGGTQMLKNLLLTSFCN